MVLGSVICGLWGAMTSADAGSAAVGLAFRRASCFRVRGLLGSPNKSIRAYMHVYLRVYIERVYR